MTEKNAQAPEQTPETPIDETQPEQTTGETETGEAEEPEEDPPEEVEASGEAGDKEADQAGKGKTPPKPDWRDKRLAKKTAEVKTLQAELAKLQGQKPQGTSESDAQFEARVNAKAEERARQLAASDAWNRDCNEATEAGRKAYGKEKFDGQVEKILDMVNLKDAQEAAAYMRFTEAALATGEAAKIFMVLGDDQEEAERIMGLPPAKQGVAMAKIAAANGDKGVTTAPKPLKPVGGKGASRVEVSPSDPSASDKLSTAEWMKRRNSDIESKRSTARH